MSDTERGTLGKVVGLALPAIFENFMMTLVNIVDVAMVGSLGAEATAAAALNAQPSWVANSVSMLVAGGATVLVARCWGTGDRRLAGVYAWHAVLLACLTGAVLSGTALLAADGYAAWMHAAPDVAPDAAAYMRIVGSAMVPFVLARGLAGVVQGTGDTVTPMKISLCANLCNLAGNFLLIYPRRTLSLLGASFPMWGAGWGVRGAAASTAASYVISACLTSAVLARRGGGMPGLAGPPCGFKRSRFRDLLGVGVPIAAERVAISTGQIFYMSVISTLGTIPVSAHFLASTAEGVCYNPAYGIATAATTLAGQALGAGDEARAEREGHVCVLFCTAVMAAVSLCMYFGADLMVGFFTDNAEIVAQGARSLRIVAAAETVFGVMLTAAGFLRGAGDTVFPIWVGIGGMYVVRLFFARLFVLRMGLGLAGAWYAMDFDILLRGAAMWLYFRSGRWKRRSRRLAARMKR